jgi:pimeloyl-ACP methyl ester carboxylesterase
MTTSRTPVLFIHGLWLHASSWEPWLDLFAEAGYAPMAPGWPGDPETVELARANPDSIAGHGIDDVTSHYAGIIAELPVRPVIIGHSFGGMIAEKLLGQDLCAAAIGIDAAQIKGVLPLAAVRAAVHPAGLQESRQRPSRRIAHRRGVPLRVRERGITAGVGRAL